MFTALRTEVPCQNEDPELFFADDAARIDVAKQICGQCPLRVECLEGALRRAEPHGVWGGELFDGGVVIARKRPRGRPRKHPVDTPAPLVATAA